MLLAGVTLLAQALLARLTASLVANVVALILLAPWAILLLIHPHPSPAARWWVSGATVAALVVFFGVLLVSTKSGNDAERVYVSSVNTLNEQIRFEMKGEELKVSGVATEAWGDTVLVTCMTRAGAYTDEEGFYAIDDIGNVATTQTEWPAGDQSLTVYFSEPLIAPPAFCAIEGSDGDIGASVFCETGDLTPIPSGDAEDSSADDEGKVAIQVDELCVESAT
jgi:hypothetical protein